jgi:hypothetical protein
MVIIPDTLRRDFLGCYASGPIGGTRTARANNTSTRAAI